MNTYLTSNIITKAALAILHNKLQFVNRINQDYTKRFGDKNNQIGDSIRIRLANQFLVRSGDTYSAGTVTEQAVTLTLATLAGVDFDIGSTDLSVKVEDYAGRWLEPAMQRLAAEIEKNVLANVTPQIWNQVGTAGTTIATAAVVLAAGEKLDEFLAPMDDNRVLDITPSANAAMVDALKGLFQSSEKISEQYTAGYMGIALGFTWVRSNLLWKHVPITTAGTILVNGASQTGATLAIDGFTSATGTFALGTVFTIAGVYAINPETKVAYSFLQQFTVTTAGTISGNAVAALAISPSIVTSGATQTVDSSPADNAALTIMSGTSTAGYVQNMGFHRDAFTFVSVAQEVPKGVDIGEQESEEGITLRLVRFYDGTNNVFKTRFDCLYGSAVLHPEFAVRLTN